MPPAPPCGNVGQVPCFLQNNEAFLAYSQPMSAACLCWATIRIAPWIVVSVGFALVLGPEEETMISWRDKCKPATNFCTSYGCKHKQESSPKIVHRIKGTQAWLHLGTTVGKLVVSHRTKNISLQDSG